MLDLGVKETTQTSEEISFESLVVDQYIENDDQEFDYLAQSYENCVMILDLVHKYGVDNDVVKELIGDQITFTSQEDLEQKLDAACEGFFGKLMSKAKDAIANKIDQAKDAGIEKAIENVKKLNDEIKAQSRRVGRDTSGWMTKGVKVPDLKKISQSLRIISNVGKLTEKTLTSNHLKGMQTVVNFLKSGSTKVDVSDIVKGDLDAYIPIMQEIQKKYLEIKQSLSGFMGATQRLPEGFSQKSYTKDADGNIKNESGYSKSDLMKYVVLARQVLTSIRTAIIQFAAGVYKASKSAQKDDQFHEEQKKYFDKKD